MADRNPFIPLARPCMGEEEIQATARPIRSGWITQGPEVRAFEEEFAAAVGAAHACAVANCTAALHLALLAVGVRPQTEVVTVSHSFIATANAIRYCGALPVFVDVEPGTFNMDPTLLEAALGSQTTAILLVHQLGMPADLAAILEVARRRSVPVIEDAACAIGSEIRWQGAWERVGRPRGDIACFSFHPRKVLSTGDGGMLTTADPAWDRQFRLWRQHGMSLPDSVRHDARAVAFESYDLLGYNYRMTDIQAAVGREQLKRLPELVSRRRALADRYREALAGIAGVALPEEPAWARSNWQSFCVGLPPGRDQRVAMQAMLDAGVATRRGVMCAHREPAYSAGWRCGAAAGTCSSRPGLCHHLRRSEHAQDHSVLLPLFPQMTEGDQDAVIATFRSAVGA